MDVLRLLYEAKPDALMEDAAYLEALDAVCKAEQAMLDTHLVIRKQFAAFQSAQLDLFAHTAYHEFSEGFRMGMWLAEEVLREK